MVTEANSKMEIKSKMIELVKIDDNVIPAIREVNRDTESYKLLENAIKKDGQRNPIIIRKLTEEEKSKVKEGVEYGIIDGHHRYQIALENNQESIHAEIDEEKPSRIRDIILAFRLNGTSIRMTPIEKGRVIYDLMKIYKDEETEKKVDEIGEEVFGLKTAMAYRCYQAYRKSIGECEQKPDTKTKFKVEKLYEAFKELHKDKIDIDSMSIEDSVGQLEAIRAIEGQLRFYKEMLLSKKGVKEAYKSQSKKSTKPE